MRITSAPRHPLPPTPPPPAPLETYPVAQDQVVTGSGWSGINKPIRVQTADGTQYVAKSNTQGAFSGLYPHHDTHMDNVREIVASHIVAEEFGMPTLTFQQGVLVADGQRTEKVLSPLRNDFQTLESASVKSIKNGDQAVALCILLGWLGDWDTTFNDSNIWVRNDGVLMGADYGYSLRPGIQAAGVPFANTRVMREFATPENVRQITDRICSLTDQDIEGMVERQGGRWIQDWSEEKSQQMSSALIANRDQLRKKNPYLDYVQGLHPGLSPAMLKMKMPIFWCKAGGAQLPPWNRPDQYLDAMEAMARYAKMNRIASMFHVIRQHVPGGEK